MFATLACACHRDMYDRSERRPLGSSPFFPDRSASRPQVPDTIPRRDGMTGAASLERGRQQFEIDCAPCHGTRGDGNGMIVQHGFPRPPAYSTAAMRALTPQDIVRVIANGYGQMYGYGDRVAEPDRWAIAAYIRQMQSEGVREGVR